MRRQRTWCLWCWVGQHRNVTIQKLACSHQVGVAQLPSRQNTIKSRRNTLTWIQWWQGPCPECGASRTFRLVYPSGGHVDDSKARVIVLCSLLSWRHRAQGMMSGRTGPVIVKSSLQRIQIRLLASVCSSSPLFWKQTQNNSTGVVVRMIYPVSKRVLFAPRAL